MDALIRVVSDVRTSEANQTTGGRLRYVCQFPEDEPIMASSLLVSGREEWQAKHFGYKMVKMPRSLPVRLVSRIPEHL